MTKSRKDKEPAKPAPRFQSTTGPVLIGVAAAVLTLATVAPGTGGPGVTCDELYHVVVGKGLVAGFRHQGFAFFTPDNIERNFPWKPGGPPVQAPLGHWILGWTHHLFDTEPDNPDSVSIVGARFAPAVALGLLALLVGLVVVVGEGPVAGSVAAAAVVLVPRVFAHGHLAALDTITVLFFTAAVLAIIEANRRGGRAWHFAAAGVVWGLAMLTRLHGLLLVPPVVVWLAWRLRRRAAVPLAVWLAAGGATFFVGWPWLWLAPLDHFRQFLTSGTGRQALNVFYSGQVWADRDVPWHYPLVMFVVALPLGLLLLGILGAWSKRRESGNDSGYLLVMGTLAFLLLVFSWPGTPVYDGTRLFLMVFPLWAISVGIGAKWVIEHRVWRSARHRSRVLLVGLFVAAQGAGLVLYHPCQLSHYSLLVGGLAGADRLGFEATYWGDAVGESLLAEAAERSPPDGCVVFGPNLAPFQALGVEISSPALLENRVGLVGWDGSWTQPPPGCRYGIFYRRKADLDQIPEELIAAEVVVDHQIQGVWLARLVRFAEPVGPSE